ncbi:MAG: glutamate synthase subunit beta [Kiritimatiellae bacterium]|nr:glutamate synthase subunit beta [Kiritimatiellia bacterium]
MEDIRSQVKRCMNCGLSFCHSYGCPLGNLVPDQNRAVADGDDRLAYELLSQNSDFPEFTSRVCPALCEASCVHQLDEHSVTIRDSERHIIETAFASGWVKPLPPAKENGKRAAVIGAGPAGLSAAITLRRQGYAVTVYEREKEIGGLLRYGIPQFKLEKSIIDRRRAVLEAEGVKFITGIEVGRDISAKYLKSSNDLLIIAIGTPQARELNIPGRELKGVHLALEFLGGQNRFVTGEINELPISAKNKRVLVIGGGNTGADCVATAFLHGAKSVTQIEVMPKPPDTRDPSTPWPLWPKMLRPLSEHEIGCKRRWSLSSNKFLGKDGHVTGVEVETVGKENSKEIIEADLVLLALGFTGVNPDHPIVTELGLALTPRTAIISDRERGIIAVGDSASGASLVVRAIASGRAL